MTSGADHASFAAAGGLERIIAASADEQTILVQEAIDAVAQGGGGRVVLEPGLHVTAGLKLRSGVDLHFRAAAVLRAIPDYDLYRDNTVDVIAEKSNRAMITARHANGISISGSGRIEAGGEAFVVGDDPAVGTLIPAEYRPRVLVLEHCSDVVLEGIEVAASPMWTLHFVNCHHLRIAEVTVSNDRRLPNTDGIVLDACSNAVIENCRISTADDGICLKTSAGPDGKAIGRCENIAVRGCEIASFSCALKIGTESFGDFTNVSFEDCRLTDCNRGLGLFSRDGGHITNVSFSRIELDCRETLDGFWGSGEPLTVTVVDRVAHRPAGCVSNLRVEDLTGRSEGAITLISTSAAPIRNVTLSRIGLRQEQGVLGTSLRYDLRPTNADMALAAGAVGRANAWTKDAAGQVIGLVDYPGGMPALFAAGTVNLVMEEVHIDRPDPLPAQWNKQDIVQQDIN